MTLKLTNLTREDQRINLDLMKVIDKPQDEILTPPLKWAGGKRWLTPIIEEIWDKREYNRLIEPFVGGMAISLGLMPPKAL
ncbi:MAG: DNA adenine methylase, partial [Waterburya sp.]